MIKTSLAVLAAALLPALAIPAFAQEAPTATPIKHVIVVIGENVSFDALYGVYQPAAGEHIRNLLSQKFVNADGTPGPDYAKVVQNVGTLTSDKYTPHAVGTTPYAKLPQPLTTGILLPNFTFAAANPDARFASLAVNGPYQVTSFVPYSTAATGDPVHRFFQMYQQTGGSNISRHSWAWVAVSAGTGGDSGNTPANPGQDWSYPTHVMSIPQITATRLQECFLHHLYGCPRLKRYSLLAELHQKKSRQSWTRFAAKR